MNCVFQKEKPKKMSAPKLQLTETNEILTTDDKGINNQYGIEVRK